MLITCGNELIGPGNILLILTSSKSHWSGRHSPTGPGPPPSITPSSRPHTPGNPIVPRSVHVP